MHRLFRFFETWIDPFKPLPDTRPPRGGFRFLLHFVQQARWPFLFMLILGGLTAAVEASVYSYVGIIVDLLNPQNRANLFAANWQILAGMVLVLGVARMLISLFTALVEEQTVVPAFNNLVRWQCHQRVMEQSLGYFLDDFAGRISAKVWQAGQAAADFMSTLLQTAWFITVYSITTLVLISRLDWRMGLGVAVWLLVFMGLARYFVPRIRDRSQNAANMGSIAVGRMVDGYTNIQTLKLFGSRSNEDAGTQTVFENFLVALQRFTRTLTSVRVSLLSLSSVMMLVIIFVALWLWQQGRVTTGDVAVTMSLILRLNMMLNRMMGQMNVLFRAMGTLQDSMEMVVRPVTVFDRPDAKSLDFRGGEIRFDDVEFKYGKSEGVIDHLSFTIRPGEKIGLVGPSGAGKSTLVNLLLRFYDVESGRILIDGQDISAVTQQSLRDVIGMVSQDTSLLHRSIRENILYGRPEAGEEAMIRAADQAHALEFIRTLEDRKGRSGFDAFVGERGVTLSGGQRQRIAIARVLLKDAPILVLDEATSALDSEVEAAIQENLATLMSGKTVIAIAHRLSTIAEMDRLLVMDQGRIVEEGTHVSLLENGGLYADLWHRQSGGFLGEKS